MNRGRHKKSKEKEFDTQAEILGTIRKELRTLLAIYESQSAYNRKIILQKRGLVVMMEEAIIL